MVTQVDGTIVFLSESIHRHMGLFQVNNKYLHSVANTPHNNNYSTYFNGTMVVLLETTTMSGGVGPSICLSSLVLGSL